MFKLNRTITWDEKFGQQYLYVAYPQLKPVYPDFVKLMKQATNNLCWSKWRNKHHFPAGVQAYSFKIPRSDVPIALRELIAGKLIMIKFITAHRVIKTYFRVRTRRRQTTRFRYYS